MTPPPRVIPDRCQVWHLDFVEAVQGEGKGPHPYLVLSPKIFNASGYVIACLITTENRAPQDLQHLTLAIEAETVSGGALVGFIHASTIHTLSWQKRRGTHWATLTDDAVTNVLNSFLRLIVPELT